MKLSRRQQLSMLGMFLFTLWGLAFLGFGFVWQSTKSMPQGIYLTYPSLKDYQKGDVVVFSPQKSTLKFATYYHWVSHRSDLLFLKKVVAVPHDFVCTLAGELYINDQKRGKVWWMAPHGIILPRFNFCGKVPKGHVFLQGTNSTRSFDSRYYGLIQTQRIKGKAKRIWAFHN